MDTELLIILITVIFKKVETQELDPDDAVLKIKHIIKDYDVAVDARDKVLNG